MVWLAAGVAVAGGRVLVCGGVGVGKETAVVSSAAGGGVTIINGSAGATVVSIAALFWQPAIKNSVIMNQKSQFWFCGTRDIISFTTGASCHTLGLTGIKLT